jgi:tetratricopeptide (TPR) repeat protein/serine/threonine protein kinase
MNERDIFIAALQLEKPAERQAYLDEACQNDPALRGRVEELLEVYRRIGYFLDRPVAGPVVTGAYTPDPSLEGAGEAQAERPEAQLEGPGTIIGPYKLIQQIGEGGMGTVFMAHQAEPVKRIVALKIIKPGMDSKQVVARFEAERQALAVMDHPNIAKVFDAGTTAAGRPYFVMELVKGVPITRYCDEHQLTPRQRLELFGPVCQAVQHAHQKGIIHRDLKPGNILIALYDGKPVPKVIDFGVAKATGQQLTERTLVTAFGAIVGTLEYMSPEQAELNQLDIDTRSDIYSLGVLLYELLTGTTPLERKRLKQAAFTEMLRIIREEEPPSPSTRLSESKDSLPSISAQRHMEPAKLTRLVRGELDWIVMKALEKDRNRRYETANGLAMDVQRYLRDEPVLAGPPSAVYRLRKFVRRNKKALAMAALLAVVLLAAVGAVAAILGWAARDREALEQEAARELARKDEEAARERAALQRQTARELARKAEEAARAAQASRAEITKLQRDGKWAAALAVAEQARDMLAGGGAGELERGREFVQLCRDLKLAAELDEIRIRKSGLDGGRMAFPRATEEYDQAFRADGIDIDKLRPPEVAERIHGRTISAELVAALDDWAMARYGATRGKKGDSLEKRLLAAVRETDKDKMRNAVRSALEDRDRKAVEALATPADLKSMPPSTLVFLAFALGELGTREQAVAVLREGHRLHPGDFWINHWLGVRLADPGSREKSTEAIRFFTAALALRPQSPAAQNNLGVALHYAKRAAEAEKAFRRGLDLQPTYARAWNNLGVVLGQQSQSPEAVKAYEEALRLDPNMGEGYHNLAGELLRLGKGAEAEKASRKALQLKYWDPRVFVNLGDALKAQKKMAEAIAEYRRAIKRRLDYPEPYATFDNELLAGAYHRLGDALLDENKPVEAEGAFRKMIEMDPTSASGYCALGVALEKRGKLAEAIEASRRATELRPDLVEAHANLAHGLRAQGKLVEAVVNYRRAIELQPNNAQTLYDLGSLLGKMEKAAEALPFLQRAVKLKPDMAEAWCNLGASFTDLKKPVEAEQALRTAVKLTPDDYLIHFNLGGALDMQRKYAEAIVSYRRAASIKPDFFPVYLNLAGALKDLGKLDEAAAAMRRAIELDPTHVEAVFGMGHILDTHGKYAEAVVFFRKAAQLQPENGLRHCALGLALGRAGQFKEALASLRRGHELGSKQPGWTLTSDRWLRDAQHRVELDAQVPAFLKGQAQPTGGAQWLEVAQVCERKRWHVAATKFYAEAFAADPKLSEDLKVGHRYNAACQAALAAAAKQTEGEPAADRPKLRQQALTWLREDLAAWHAWLDKAPAEARPILIQYIVHWQDDSDLAAVRGAQALNRLPEAERQNWQQLWSDVAALLTKARG